MKLNVIGRFLLNPIVQVGMIALVSLILYLMSVNYLSTLHNLDPLPSLVADSSGDTRVKIKTGFFVNNFLNFDPVKNQFTVLGTIWFEFNSKEVDLADLENSMFSKGEAEGQASLRGKYEEVKPLVQHNGDITYAQYPTKIDFISNLDYKLFPFDSHRIFITLNNMYLDASKFKFVADQGSFSISPNLLIYGWSVVNKQVYTGAAIKQLSQNQTATYPRVIYALDFQRDSIKDLLLLLFPLLVSFFMGMFTFCYNHKVYRTEILSTGVATVAAMMAYRFVIDTVSPYVPYMMLIDWLFIMFLLLAFAGFLINAFDLFNTARGWVMLSLYLILIGAWYWALYIWGAV